MKTCTKCRKEKPLTPDHFRPRQYRGKPAWSSHCRDCERAYNNAYKDRPDERARQAAYMRGYHKDRRRSGDREYIEENKRRCKQWWATNRARAKTSSLARYEKIKGDPALLAKRRERVRIQHAEYYRTRPNYRLKSLMLAHIKLALRRQSKTRAEKPGRLEHLLGYTIDQLREHLERQFSGSMSWRNQGRWHIDHIRPVKSFQLANEDGLANVSAIRECWALTNLRPLWAKKNMEKGSQEIFLI